MLIQIIEPSFTYHHPKIILPHLSLQFVQRNASLTDNSLTLHLVLHRLNESIQTNFLALWRRNTSLKKQMYWKEQRLFQDEMLAVMTHADHLEFFKTWYLITILLMQCSLYFLISQEIIYLDTSSLFSIVFLPLPINPHL